ncbi:hypothetical protein BU17DRAFT_54790 [Hysterangium stoloniferum]|nr:hypothetical protein BU17DRAFT_54790 [Hysterangium stoloniferum]
MPVSITIEPLVPTIDMYDSPDTSSAYSLSGHVTIKLTPSSSVFGLSRTTSQSLLLTSLELTFEGQSELVLNEAGYVPLRILTLTKELVSSSQPVHISSDEDSAEWRVVFNIAVPGWLPATCAFGDEAENQPAGVNYALFARAKFLSANDLEETGPAASTSSSSVWNNLCSVMRFGASRHRVIHAEKCPICVTRYVSPPTQSYEDEDVLVSAFPSATYSIQAVPESGPATNIPADVLRSVQLHAILPTKVSAEDDTVPLAIRLRSRSNDSEIRNRLKVHGFEADVIQLEKYYTSPCPSYTARFPLPPVAQQPPMRELKAPHPVGALFDLGLILSPLPNRKIIHERSLVPSDANRIFKAHGTDGSEDGVRFEESWIRMGVDVPVFADLHERAGKRVATSSPLFAVAHEMRVRVTIGYEDPDKDEQVFDELAFTVPLEFVHVTPETLSPAASTFFPVLVNMHSQAPSTASLPLPHPPMTISRTPLRSRSVASLRAETGACHASPFPSRPSTPFPPPLPAYNQLYYENGDRKDDILGALPVYRQKEELPPPPPPLQAVLTHAASESTSSLQSDCPALVPSSFGPSSPPDSPVSPGSPVTPPGLLSVPPPHRRRRHSKPRKGGRGKSSKSFFGESFLRLEDESDIDIEAHSSHGRGDVEATSILSGDVQYGVAL